MTGKHQLRTRLSLRTIICAKLRCSLVRMFSVRGYLSGLMGRGETGERICSMKSEIVSRGRLVRQGATCEAKGKTLT